MTRPTVQCTDHNLTHLFCVLGKSSVLCFGIKQLATSTFCLAEPLLSLVEFGFYILVRNCVWWLGYYFLAMATASCSVPHHFPIMHF